MKTQEFWKLAESENTLSTFNVSLKINRFSNIRAFANYTGNNKVSAKIQCHQEYKKNLN